MQDAPLRCALYTTDGCLSFQDALGRAGQKARGEAGRGGGAQVGFDGARCWTDAAHRGWSAAMTRKDTRVGGLPGRPARPARCVARVGPPRPPTTPSSAAAPPVPGPLASFTAPPRVPSSSSSCSFIPTNHRTAH